MKSTGLAFGAKRMQESGERGQTATNKNGLKPTSSHHLPARPLNSDQCQEPAEAPVSLVPQEQNRPQVQDPRSPRRGRAGIRALWASLCPMPPGTQGTHDDAVSCADLDA